MSLEPGDLLRRLAETLSFASLLEDYPVLKPADLRRLLRKSAELWDQRRSEPAAEEKAPPEPVAEEKAPLPEPPPKASIPATVATLLVDVFIDGACKGNPGPSGVGFVIAEPDGGLEFVAEGKFIGEGTNNVAEYSALLEALSAAESYGFRRLRIHSDSQLLVRQIQGRYKVKEPTIQKLHELARQKLARFEHIEMIHVPREQNSRADALAGEAVKAVLKKARPPRPLRVVQAAEPPIEEEAVFDEA